MKLFEPSCCEGFAGMDECSTGGWVRYEDAAKLEAELEATKYALYALRKELTLENIERRLQFEKAQKAEAELKALKSNAVNCAQEVIALHENCDGDPCRCDLSAYESAERILEATKEAE